MSSLLQFHGETSRKGVHLQFYQTKESETECLRDSAICGDPVDEVHCATCGKTHPRVHIAIRKPAGMFGCWVVFQYNGEEHVPDLSHPIAIFKLPRDARPVSDEENSRIWHG